MKFATLTALVGFATASDLWAELDEFDLLDEDDFLELAAGDCTYPGAATALAADECKDQGDKTLCGKDGKCATDADCKDAAKALECSTAFVAPPKDKTKCTYDAAKTGGCEGKLQCQEGGKCVAAADCKDEAGKKCMKAAEKKETKKETKKVFLKENAACDRKKVNGDCGKDLQCGKSNEKASKDTDKCHKKADCADKTKKLDCLAYADPSAAAGGNGLAIGLGVTGGVLALAGIGYYVYKKKKDEEGGERFTKGALIVDKEDA